MRLSDLIALEANEQSALLASLEIWKIERFLSLCTALMPEIEEFNRQHHSSPAELQISPQVRDLLSTSLSLEAATIDACWEILRGRIPQSSEINGPLDLLAQDTQFRQHGLATMSLPPPFQHCRTIDCDRSHLTYKAPIRATLYTLRRGAIPILCPSYYCTRCLTRYYHNYSVTRASQPDAQRQYYGGTPRFIEISDHSFVDIDLCDWFGAQMAFPQSSSMNIAQVYSLTLSCVPPHSDTAYELTGDVVLHAFLLYSLLCDATRRHLPLVLPHRGENRDRLRDALMARNLRMAGTGQEMWAHSCNMCTKIITKEDGKLYRISAGVTDGVTVGHPCCSVHDCKIPLTKQKDKFCLEHADLNDICHVKGCSQPTEVGFKTCCEPLHRQFEMDRQTADKARPRLQAHLRRAQAEDTPFDKEDSNQSGESKGTGLQKVKGNLGRSWTHNEQLFVKCCSIITSRATFFGSEGLFGVHNFLLATFPPQFPMALPSYIYYDNNCSYRLLLISIGDTYILDKVGLPVDVFHFSSKHKATDIACQTYCNPASFPELTDSLGNWVFNSSVAEQVNVWFGGFQSIVREMTVERYNFFLDEMISIRNRVVAGRLEKRGHQPYILDDDVLRGL